ncbi:zf-CCHC domain-containing protein [Tanacetum coccineum]
MKESHSKNIRMTKMAKAKGNVLNAVIQIISLVNVQKRRESIIKEILLEDVGVIANEDKEKKTKEEKFLIIGLKHINLEETKVETVKSKREQNRSIVLKARKESSDENSSSSDSEDEEYAIADDKNGKSERKCFKCGDPNHLIGECPKASRIYNQRAFVGGCWSDSDEDEEKKTNDAMIY